MYNPLTKIMSFLGITGIQDRDIHFDPGWTPGERGTAGGSKVPLHLRVAKRRRKNKQARKSRQKNRS